MYLLLAQMGLTLAQALAEDFIDDEEYLKWARLGLAAFRSATNAEQRLRNLNEHLRDRLEAGSHFEKADFDGVVAEIAGRDRAWADL